MNQITFGKTIISKKAKLIIGLSVFIVIAGFLLRFTPFGQRVPLPQFAKNVIVGQSEEAKKAQETKNLVTKVGQYIILPKGEDPVVALINDRELLAKEQKFYQDAQNGDVLLIYPKAAKAIIYSPKRNILVNVGPLISPGTAGANNPPPQAAEATLGTATPQGTPLKIEIRNGTDKSGLASTIKKSLEKNALFQITGTTDAGKKDYDKTLIVDTGKTNNKEAVQQLSQMLGVQTISKLPTEEKATNADVLVILGKDQSQN